MGDAQHVGVDDGDAAEAVGELRQVTAYPRGQRGGHPRSLPAPPPQAQPDDRALGHRGEQLAARRGRAPRAASGSWYPPTQTRSHASRRASTSSTGRTAAADFSSTVTRVRGQRREHVVQVGDGLGPVHAADPHPVQLGRRAPGEPADGVGGAVEGAVVVDDRDPVGGGVHVELEVAEALVDGPPERRHGVLQAGQLVEVPAAVGVGAWSRPVEVGMGGHGIQRRTPSAHLRAGDAQVL